MRIWIGWWESADWFINDKLFRPAVQSFGQRPRGGKLGDAVLVASERNRALEK
jgi:hypothetical protein